MSILGDPGAASRNDAIYSERDRLANSRSFSLFNVPIKHGFGFCAKVNLERIALHVAKNTAKKLVTQHVGQYLWPFIILEFLFCYERNFLKLVGSAESVIVFSSMRGIK